MAILISWLWFGRYSQKLLPAGKFVACFPLSRRRAVSGGIGAFPRVGRGCHSVALGSAAGTYLPVRRSLTWPVALHFPSPYFLTLLLLLSASPSGQKVTYHRKE